LYDCVYDTLRQHQIVIRIRPRNNAILNPVYKGNVSTYLT